MLTSDEQRAQPGGMLQDKKGLYKLPQALLTLLNLSEWPKELRLS